MIEHLELLRGDLDWPVFEALSSVGRVAWDIETSGLSWSADHIGTCQLHSERTGTIVVQVADSTPTLLRRLLADPSIEKVFHHAPFDLRFMSQQWDVEPANVSCTKVASRLLNPEPDSRVHSLKFLLDEFLGVRIDKGPERVSDWSASNLSDAQLAYAAGDVRHLLPLIDVLEKELLNRDLLDLYRRCLDFLPTRVRLETGGWPDVFAY